jgi:hypothetical protein
MLVEELRQGPCFNKKRKTAPATRRPRIFPIFPASGRSFFLGKEDFRLLRSIHVLYSTFMFAAGPHPALLKAPIGYCKKVTERLAPSSFKLSGVADLWRVPPPPHTPTVKHYTVAKAVLWKVAVLRMKSLLLMPEHFAPRPYWYFTFLHPKNVFRSL